MEQKQLTELKKLLKVLQEAGVTEYKTADIELKLEPQAARIDGDVSEKLTDVAVPFDELPLEDQLLYSAVQQQQSDS